jgi:hypothetical protein
MALTTSRICLALALLAGGASAIPNYKTGGNNAGATEGACDVWPYSNTCWCMCRTGFAGHGVTNHPEQTAANCRHFARGCNSGGYQGDVPSRFYVTSQTCDSVQDGTPYTNYGASDPAVCDPTNDATNGGCHYCDATPVSTLAVDASSPTCSGCGLLPADKTTYEGWCSLSVGGTNPKVCNVQAPATQTNINTLGAQNCDVIAGAMSINSLQAGHSDRISDITPLASIKVICGTLSMANTLLSDLSGLDNLRLVTGAVNIVAGTNANLNAAGISSGLVNAQLALGMPTGSAGTTCGPTATCAVDVAATSAATNYTEMTTCGENGDETLHKYDDRAGCCEDMNEDDLDEFINSIDSANPALVAACNSLA